MNKKILLITVLAILVGTSIVYAAPKVRYERNVEPEEDSVYYLGTTTPSTNAWKGVVSDQFCLTGDTCITEWATGGGSGSGTFSTTTVFGTTLLQYPITNVDVTSLDTNSTSTSKWWYDSITNEFRTTASSTFQSTTTAPCFSNDGINCIKKPLTGLFQSSSKIASTTINGNLTVAYFGDSMMTEKFDHFNDLFIGSFDDNGIAFDQGASSYSAGVTKVQNDFDYWFNGMYYTIPATDTFTTVEVESDTLKVFYISENGGGQFKIQVDVDGSGSFYDIDGATIDTDNLGIPVSNVYSLSTTSQSYRIKIVGISGTSKILGTGLYRTDRDGFTFVNLHRGGIDLNQMDSLSTNILDPVITSIAPDLYIFEMKDTDTLFNTYFPSIKSKLDNAYSPSDWFFIGSSPFIDAENNALQIRYNTNLEKYANDNRYGYIDMFDIFVDSATMQKFNLIDTNDIHLTNAGEKYSTREIYSRIKSFLPEDIKKQLTSEFGFIVDTNALVVDYPTGNVGIGTNNPSTAKLVIERENLDTNPFVDYQYNNLTRFLVTNAGSVLIGAGAYSVGTPSMALHVVNSSGGLPSLGSQIALFQNNSTVSTNSILAILSGTSGISGIQLGDTDSIARGYIQYYNSSDYLAFGSAGAERFRVTSTGLIGVGTTTPLSLLNIANATAPKFTLSDTNATTDQKHWFIESDTGKFGIGTTSDSLVTNETYRALTINETSNVGIGTSSPYTDLSVNGETAASYFTAYSNSANTLPYASTTALTVTGGLYNSALTSGRVPIITTNGRLTDDSQLIYSSGHLTTNQLTISAQTSGRIPIFGTDGVITDSSDLSFNSSTGELTLGAVAGTTTLAGGLKVDTKTIIADFSTNNVGIGTTTPGQKLSVAGDILGNNIIGSYFTATSTTLASTFPLASTTQLTTNILYAPLSSSLLLSATTSMGTGTTTRRFTGHTQAWNLTKLGCSANGGGTFQAQVGDGTSTSTLVTSETDDSTAFTAISANNSFTAGEAFYIAFGGVSSTVSQPSCSIERTLK